MILQASPGAGKTTIIPIELLNEPWLAHKKILMLEPRRLAVKATSQRISELLSDNHGTKAGYKIRFENTTGPSTKIEIITEGILTRMLQMDNALQDYGLVIFDEFHERNIHSDAGLSLCREIQEVLREDLRILIMSATIEAEIISASMGHIPIIKCEGRQFPIKFQYQEYNDKHQLIPEISNLIVKAVRENDGDVLVFLPGAGEIKKISEILKIKFPALKIHELYGDLPYQQQRNAILPDMDGFRKIILSTSISETSLTIEGVKIVVDSGFSRIPKFDPRSGLTRLETIKVSRDVADQRAGRAGRLGPGICYRLWNEKINHQLAESRSPEIVDADLAPLALELFNWGINNPSNLKWITPPPAGAYKQATELLEKLGAISENKITTRGKEILRLPAHPRIAHLLLKGVELNIAALAIDIASILEEKDPLSKESGANITLRIDALRRWRKNKINIQGAKILQRIEKSGKFWRTILNIEVDNSSAMDYEVGRLIAAAYPERIAKAQEDGKRYRLANGRFAKLPDADPLSNSKWLAISNIDAGGNEGRIFLAAPVNPDDLEFISIKKIILRWDYQLQKLISRMDTAIGDLNLYSVPVENIPQDKAISILMEVVKTEGLSVFNQSEEMIEWRTRVESLKYWQPEIILPDLKDASLLKRIEEWLPPHLHNITIKKKSDFQKINIFTVIKNMLNWEQQKLLDRLAPAEIPVPSGSIVKLKYSVDGSAPILSVRLQEVFGLTNTPTVNNEKIKILLHLLSPGYKPVQITQDLNSFWKNTYPGVRKELKIRYPRHSWPEDPWTAQPVKGPKKRP